MKILDIGCGNHKMKGAIGIDKNSDTQADIVHDPNKFPYPFNENEFDSLKIVQKIKKVYQELT